MANDNDFLSSVNTISHSSQPYGNQWQVYAFSDADLAAVKPGAAFMPQGPDRGARA